MRANLQARTGGISEFVPLPFVHMESPIYLAGAARRGPTLRECILMHAVARLVLHPLITNIQASWWVMFLLYWYWQLLDGAAVVVLHGHLA